jgi:hypothetical protein
MGIPYFPIFQKVKATMLSSICVSSGAAEDSERRLNEGLLNCHRARKNVDTRNTYPLDKKRPNHLLHLRSITSKLLWEDSDVQTSSIDGASASKNAKPKTKPKGISIRAFNNANKPFQKITPWVESSVTVDDEASPTGMLAVNYQQSDTMTEHSTLCSAFEMLSYENFCSATTGEPQKSITKGGPVPVVSPIEPLKVISVSPARDDFVVPREISFENQNICGGCTPNVGCSPMPRDAEVHVIKRQRSRNTKQAFKKWLLPCKPPKVDKSTRVMQVKVYVDPPRPFGSNNSVGNSTLTMPRELISSSTNTTI